MAKQTYMKCFSEDRFPLNASDVPLISGVAGHVTKVVGKVSLPMSVGELNFSHPFYILESMNHEVILGVDFLQEHKATVSFDSNHLVFQDSTTVPLVSKTVKPIYVRTVCNVFLPAKTQTIFRVQCTEAKLKDGIIEPVPSLYSEEQLVGAKCVVKSHYGKTVYQIMNPTDNDLQLKRNQVVGLWEPLSDDIRIEGFEVDGTTVDAQPSDGRKSNTIHATDSVNPSEILNDLGISMTNSDLTTDQKNKLMEFLAQNKLVFARDTNELGTTDLHFHRIDTGDAKPVHQRFYRTSPAHKAEIDKQIQDMLKADIIEPSTSPWASPVVLVKKKNGDFRFAVDYRRLNRVTRPMSFPLPRPDDVYDTIGESHAQVFTVLDLASGFWQIPLDRDSRAKTAFTSHSGNYQFKKLPFGLMNAPVSFQMVMTQVLRGLTWKFALVYVDDIIIFSPDFDTHLKHLSAVFDRLRGANLKLKPQKCHFAAKEVTYLGHVISKNGIQVNPAKTAVIQTFPVPKDQSEVRAFLGICNYYRRFVNGYANIAAPLNRLLQRDVQFVWTNDCDLAFQMLKQALISPPILRYPNFDKEFILATDASGYAISYILSQLDETGREVVIQYGGRALTKAEQKWSITEREGLAVVEGIKVYRVYLANRKFTVHTDHVSLQWLRTIHNATGRLGRWSVLLQGYDFDIVHKSGQSHGNADALSRRQYESHSSQVPITEPTQVPLIATPSHAVHEQSCETIEYKLTYATDTPPVCSIDGPSVDQSVHIRHRQRSDDALNQYIMYLDDGYLPPDQGVARRIVAEAQDYIVQDGILYHYYYPRGKGHKVDRQIKQLVVPTCLRNDIFLSYHDSLLGGHQGIDRTYNSIRQKYYWPKMFADTENYVKSCTTCQRIKVSHHGKHAPLQPLPVGDVFSRLHIDILGPLPTSPKGYKYILLVVDSFSKWCEAFPLKSQDAAEIANIFYNEIICRYGAPSSLLSDRGAQFMSKLLKELCKIFQITKIQTSSYHPQTNASCERMNSFIWQTLRAYCKPDQSNWVELLPSVMFAYRSTPATESTQLSPFMILFGRECKLPIDTELIPPSSKTTTSNQTLERIMYNFDVTRKIAKENIQASQGKYKAQYDKKAKVPEFQEGQKVWLYCAKKQVGLSPKMCHKWLGPYYICEARQNFTYTLRRCSDNKLMVSPVHANRLKHYHDPKDRPSHIPQGVDESNQIGEDLFPDSELSLGEGDIEPTPSDTGHVPQTPPVVLGHPKLPNDKLVKDPASEQKGDWFIVHSLRRSAIINGKRHYQVKWKGYSNTTWEPEDNIPEELIHDFHIRKTKRYQSNKKRAYQRRPSSN